MRKLLALAYTYKCNFKCKHCLNESGPSHSKRIGLSMAKKIARYAIKNHYETISITGGESLIFESEILKLLKYIKKNSNLSTTIFTNAYWAINFESTYKRLLKLKEAGLNEINVSWDIFHSQYVKISNVFNLLEASNKLGIKFNLSTLNIDKNNKDVKKLFHEASRARTSQIIKSGRAKKLPSKYFNSFAIKQIQMNCPYVGNILIGPNCDVFACCSSVLDIQKTSPLYFGNLKKDKFYIFNKFKENPIFKSLLFKIIYFRGPYGIFSILPKHLKEKLSKKRFSGLCEFCIFLFNQKEVQIFLKNNLKN